ncbi:serine--tRNA ligase [Sphingomonas corticis]|jgi:seryl-tRNA synthetase|uniref:Serine--tRNA ligase n=1 Tax=Sphingomonas corticis TaxID=2722791 RepID=A0ABX1CLR1_9SPHN|nr:serine--tRNA ligase [Sphingomonas corticis]NJR77305.1 serine--tRNA ligase [Sphingomonas corticis]
MHDIRLIRDDPAAFDAALARRGLAPVSAEVLAIDERARALTTEVQALLARRNEASKEIGAARSRRDDPTDLMAEVAALKERLPELEAEQKAAAATLVDRLATIPNLPADDVPDGADESHNVELKRWGTPRTFAFAPKEHADLGPALGLDFETGARLSGARFTFLRGGIARLHRALAQFMIDRHVDANGYVECNPPVLVNDAAMYGTDKLPKFADDSFRTTDGRWLIPTAEVSLTASVADRILDELAEPMRMAAHTLCFRSEAGAAGRDTRGFIRQHQFEKVELVSICRPDETDAEHERMTRCAEGILEKLDLPYRRLLLCTGDMGFGARRTFDLEVWLPGQDAWREISSCSAVGDFQARRMNARYRPDGEKGTRFVHTLNGSGLAVGRTLVAVIENYQQEDGSVAIPSVLQPYLGGLTVLEPRR